MNAFILIKVLVVSLTFLAKILFYFVSTKDLPNKTDGSEKPYYRGSLYFLFLTLFCGFLISTSLVGTFIANFFCSLLGQ